MKCWRIFYIFCARLFFNPFFCCRRVPLSLKSTIKKKYAEEISRWITLSGFFARKWGNYLKNHVRWIWRELFRFARKWKPRYANQRYASLRNFLFENIFSSKPWGTSRKRILIPKPPRNTKMDSSLSPNPGEVKQVGNWKTYEGHLNPKLWDVFQPVRGCSQTMEPSLYYVSTFSEFFWSTQPPYIRIDSTEHQQKAPYFWPHPPRT